MNKFKVKSKYLMLGLLMVVFGSYYAMANNIQVSNVSLVGQNTSQNYSMIKFDLSWDNSWRVNTIPLNNDAAWVFVKVRPKKSSEWIHAKLHYVDGSGTNDGHVKPTGGLVISSDDNGGTSNGVFIYRNTYMSQGSVNYQNIKLRWDYGANGLQDNDSVEVCVYAIEMVKVNLGPYYLGSGGTELRAFYKYPTTTNSYRVLSENAITIGTATGNLYYNTATTTSIPASFPKGYNGFYCMKYEVSQGQYADFLNKISSVQASNNWTNRTGSYNNNINNLSGDYQTTTPYTPCNYLTWEKLTAYLDWAALRPMTELEYEKASRGGALPEANEYAWGTSLNVSAVYSVVNKASVDSKITSGYSSSAYIGNAATMTTISSSTGGPIRCGIFAANISNTGRVSSGATYFGIMEMSGNLEELVVSVGNSQGRSFTGVHGDGALNTSGAADVNNWPLTVGSGTRGGSWRNVVTRLRISDRTSASSYISNDEEYIGGRGIRTAP